MTDENMNETTVTGYSVLDYQQGLILNPTNTYPAKVMLKCDNCGQENLEPLYNFCPNCGRKIINKTP